MNKSKRQGIFFISIFIVNGVGIFLLKWTTIQCILLLGLFAVIMKLTDIEETIGDIK